VLEACHKAAHELYDEIAAASADFRKIYEPWRRFRDDQYLWFRVAENAFDNFVYSVGQARPAGKT
jgi:TRAP-type mannitol/chloroaromatic compound transport system substrate-binding protein